jgi:Peptidase A4 family
MRSRPTIPFSIRRALLPAALALASALIAPSAADAATLTSSNWSGYVARATGSGKSRFSSVSGSWIVPSSTCATGRETSSAVWVGLGGFGEKAKALEQVGSEADCTSSGHARYSAWVELLPAAAVTLHLKVSPGDELTASVTVSGHDATLRLRNLTTGQGVSRTRRAARIDVSTAEWIVEAPSGCDEESGCQTLRLTDFGQVAFSGASATARAHTGSIVDGHWNDTELSLSQSPAASASSTDPEAGTLITATPSAAGGGAFTVAYGEQAGEAATAPTLPGGGGGPPP